MGINLFNGAFFLLVDVGAGYWCVGKDYALASMGLELSAVWGDFWELYGKWRISSTTLHCIEENPIKSDQGQL